MRNIVVRYKGPQEGEIDDVFVDATDKLNFILYEANYDYELHVRYLTFIKYQEEDYEDNNK
jgi:hypothetical protein